MHELMVGMFWGGVVMAMPPILVGAAFVWLLLGQKTDPPGSVESGENTRR